MVGRSERWEGALQTTLSQQNGSMTNCPRMQAAKERHTLSMLLKRKIPNRLTDERLLVDGCVKGYESYRYELYQRHAPKMFVVCKRYAGSREDAEDYMQEGFVRVFEKLHTYSFSGSLEGWIRKVITRACLNHLRSRRLYADITEYAPIADVNAPDALNEMSEQELIKLISTLPQGYRTVFNMYAIDGYDHAEIAEALGINEGTSRSQLAKARMWLKHSIEKNLIPESHAHQA
ncbi:MAG: RNA polymerase sigma factor [Flavobacteriales bacterium]